MAASTDMELMVAVKNGELGRGGRGGPEMWFKTYNGDIHVRKP